jgi:Ni/Fe-hydrogenase 1 B-type cytochrome subunit
MSKPSSTSTWQSPDIDALIDAAPAFKKLYVAQAPVRIWHWLNALSIVGLAITGYLIGSPPNTTQGEASAHFVFGDIRFVHFICAYVFAAGLLVRLYWAFVGNHYAREIFHVPIFSRAYWRDFVSMLKWYMLISPRPNRYYGHNPLARMMIFLLYFLLSIFMVCSGFAMYGEGDQAGSWANTLFTSWMLPLFGNSQSLHTWHHLGMWVILTFIILHIYAAVREDIMGRQSMMSTMVSGYRYFRE